MPTYLHLGSFLESWVPSVAHAADAAYIANTPTPISCDPEISSNSHHARSVRFTDSPPTSEKSGAQTHIFHAIKIVISLAPELIAFCKSMLKHACIRGGLPLSSQSRDSILSHLVLNPWMALMHANGTRGEMLVFTFGPVSYTHLTLPTICSV